MLIRKPRFEDRFSPLCSIEGDQAPSGGDGGGGGSGGGGDAPAAPTNSGPVGGASPPDASFSFSQPSRSTPADANTVRQVLDKGQDPEHKLTNDDIRALLSWDPPMGKKAQPPQQSQPGATPDGQQQQPPAATGTTPPDGATPPAPAPLDPSLAALVERLDKLAATPAPPQPQGQGAQTQQPQQPKRFYGDLMPALEVSPQFAASIFNAESPEQAHKSLNLLVSEMMNRVMQDTSQLILAQQQRMMQMIPQVVSTHHDGRSNTEKFYTKFPNLNRPGYQPMVQAAAQTVAQARHQAGKSMDFSEEVMKEISEEVYKQAEAQFGINLRPAPVKPNPAPQGGKPNGKPAAKGAFFTPNGARPPADQGGPGNQSADLRSMVI